MAYDNPPTDASPKNLLALCNALSDGSLTADELDDSDIGLSKTVIRDTLRYGIRLGFINEDDDGKLKLTDRGWDIAFVDDVDETVEKPFRTGIQDWPLYSDLIDKIVEEDLLEKGDPNTITQKQILPILNRSFGFSELSTESTLKPATTTFLQTLDAAGYGNYVIGRGGKPTRIEVNDDFRELTREERRDGEGAPRDGDDRGDDRRDDVEDERGSEKTPEEESGSDDTEQRIQTDVGGTDLNIEIQISSADWTSEEVLNLIESLRDDAE